MQPKKWFIGYAASRSSSLWSYMNPRQKVNGKELSDVLVVCDPHVIIFSVKHVGLRQSGDPATNAERWKRAAVHESVAQLHGADRKIKTMMHVIRNDNSLGVPLPVSGDMRVHRIAIALGGQGLVGMGYGHFDKGLVHVFDEQSVTSVLTELDTVTDFAKYLSEKERYLTSGAHLVCNGAEEDLLATYLQMGRKFPESHDVLVLDGDLWKAFQSKAEYQNKVIADKGSYAWDKIIETFCRDLLHDNLEFAPGLTATERAIRVMAKEDRFARRVVGKSFAEFLDESHNIRARHVRSPSGVEYVFLATPHGFPRDVRQAELGNRCFVVRGLNPEATTIVGLATEQYTPGKGFSFDLVHMFKPIWTPEDQAVMEKMQSELGYFVRPKLSQTSEDEYPLIVRPHPED
jgi:hypothetical protein